MAALVLKSTPIFIEGSRGLALAGENKPQAIMRAGIRWVEVDRLCQGLTRPLGVFRFHKLRAQVVVGFSESRIDFDGLAKILDSIRHLPLYYRQKSEFMPGASHSRVKLHGLSEGLLSSVDLS